MSLGLWESHQNTFGKIMLLFWACLGTLPQMHLFLFVWSLDAVDTFVTCCPQWASKLIPKTIQHVTSKKRNNFV